ncbi:MAG: A24 family peptidase [Gordonia sp. (in: high G+C Gram-positive bacteria)]
MAYSWLAGAVLVLWFGAVSVVDLRCGRIPNRLVVPGLTVAVAITYDDPPAASAAVLAAAPYLAGFLAGACGGGDVKLAPVCGAVAGDPFAALCVVLLASLLTLGGLVVVRVGSGDSGLRGVAHGPALAASTAVMWLLANV